MEREYGVTIDLKKSSTLSVPGTFNPLVIIKKLNFNHSIIESKDRDIKSPEKKIISPKKNMFNFNSNNNSNKIVNNNPITKFEINTNKLLNIENNNLLKSIRINKNKKEKTEMSNSGKEINELKRISSVRNLASPVRIDKEEKAETVANENNINILNHKSEKIFEKIEKRNHLIASEKRRERDNKVPLRGKSSMSERNENNKDKDNLNNSIHLKTISEKGKKKKKKKDKNENNKNGNNAGVILPKIINTSANYNTNKECNISNSKNEEEKNACKETLRKNYSQSIAQFRKTSESAFMQKRMENNNSANSNYGSLGINNTNRYTSVMKIYRDKKMHFFDKNKSFYVSLN